MSTAARQQLADVIDRMQDKMMVGAGGAKTRDDALELGEARPDYLFFGRFGYDNTPDPHPRNLTLGRWWAEMIEIPCIVLAGSDDRVGRGGRGNRRRVRGAVERRLRRRRRRGRGDRPRQRTARRDRAAFRGLTVAVSPACVLPPLSPGRRRGEAAPCPSQSTHPPRQAAAGEPALAPARRAARRAAAAGRLPTRPPSTVDPERFGDKKRLDPAYGAFQRGLYVTALNLALPRARNGDPAAQTLVAEILSRGLGVPRNEVEAAKWYALASEQGIPEAQFQYALLLLDGALRQEGRQRRLCAAARPPPRPAIVLAQFNFAQLIVDREPGEAGMAKAVSYYERAARAGPCRRAIRDVAGLRQRRRRQEARRGRSAALADAGRAAEFRHRAARSRHLAGRGPRRRQATCKDRLRLAEARGARRQCRRAEPLAKLYVQGIGIDPDQIIGAAWYILARRAGLTDPEMDDFLNGLTAEETKQALEKANRLR